MDEEDSLAGFMFLALSSTLSFLVIELVLVGSTLFLLGGSGFVTCLGASLAVSAMALVLSTAVGMTVTSCAYKKYKEGKQSE